MRTKLHIYVHRYREKYPTWARWRHVSELLTDRIRIRKSGDNVNSKSDYTIGLIVLDLQSQIARYQNYTQNFISFTTAKNPKIARQ